MAENIGKLSYAITADNGQFTVGMGKAGADVEKFANQTKAQSTKIESSLQGIGNQANGLFQSLSSNGPAAAMSALSSEVTGLASSFASAVGPVGLFAAAVTGGFAALAHQASSAVKEIEQINKTARTLGESPRSVQVLLQAFQNAGFAASEAQSLLLRFESRLGEVRQGGSSPTGDALRRIGLDPRAIANADLKTAFTEILQALKDVPNAYDRSRASQEIFGKSFMEMAELISKGRQSIDIARRDVDLYGPSQEVLDRVRQMTERMKDLKNQTIDSGKVIASVWREVLVEAKSYLDAIATGIAGATQLGIRRYIPNLYQRVNPDYVTGGPNFRAAPSPVFDVVQQTSEATKKANDLIAAWSRSATTIGLSARQVAIVGLNITELERTRLINQDRLLTRLEQEFALRRAMTDQLNSQNLALSGITAGSREAALLENGRNAAILVDRDRAAMLQRGVGVVMGLRQPRVKAAEPEGMTRQLERITDLMREANEIAERTGRDTEDIFRELRDAQILRQANGI